MAKKPANVHPSIKRPEPEYRVGKDGIDTRNQSCDLIDRGYYRQGVREGFVMIPRHGSGACIVLLFPKYANARM